MSWFDKLKALLGGNAPASGPDLDMLTCDQVQELLYEFVDEELDPVTRNRVQHHLDTQPCPCQRLVLFEIAFLNRVKGAAEGEPVPAGLRDRIVDLLAGNGSSPSA